MVIRVYIHTYTHTHIHIHLEWSFVGKTGSAVFHYIPLCNAIIITMNYPPLHNTTSPETVLHKHSYSEHFIRSITLTPLVDCERMFGNAPIRLFRCDKPLNP